MLDWLTKLFCYNNKEDEYVYKIERKLYPTCLVCNEGTVKNKIYKNPNFVSNFCHIGDFCTLNSISGIPKNSQILNEISHNQLEFSILTCDTCNYEYKDIWVKNKYKVVHHISYTKDNTQTKRIYDTLELCETITQATHFD